MAGFVWYGSSQPAPAVRQNPLLASPDTVATSPLDQLSSADIAVHIARLANLAEKQAVATNADSINAQLNLAASDQNVVAKPQIVATELKSYKDIQKYVVQSGDTVSSIAEKFSVTSDTVRWSNGIVGDSIAIGKEVWVLPGVNGIVYVAKSGDTVDALAQKYGANKQRIVAYNDTEIRGLPVGERVIIPGGTPPAQTTTPVASTRGYGGAFSWGGYAPIYGGNGYDYGYCTWWAAVRRTQVGKPIPSNLGNASTWKVLAQQAGLGVGNVPEKHAVIWTPPRDYYGHVAFVEEVYPDGSIKVSEMNTVGWGVTSYKTLTAGEAAGYSYIY